MNTTATTVIRRTVATGAVASLALLGAAVTATSASAVEPETLADVSTSLVYVESSWTGYVNYPTDGGWKWSDAITITGQCTGWFASDEGHIVTAGHCVTDEGRREAVIKSFLTQHDAMSLYAEAKSGWLVEGLGDGSPLDKKIQVIQPTSVPDPVIDTWTIAQLVDFEEFLEGDAALLKVSNLTETTPGLAIADGNPVIGEELVSIGYPSSVQRVVDVNRLSASFKTGTVSSMQLNDRGIPYTEINADVSPGMSGGPTIDESGRVLGINSFKITGETESFNFITDTQSLVRFLSRNAVPVVTAPAPAAETAPGAEVAGAEVATAAGTSGDATVTPVEIAQLGGAEKQDDAGLPTALVVVVGGLAVVGLLVLATAVVVAVTVLRRNAARATADALDAVFDGTREPATEPTRSGSATAEPQREALV